MSSTRDKPHVQDSGAESIALFEEDGFVWAVPRSGGEAMTENSKTPYASVIVPTYGERPVYLNDALRSVQGQRLAGAEYEIVVIDNSPTGSAIETVNDVNRDAARPVRYAREPRAGLHNARHAGAREAHGEILVYIDDDVIVDQDWLKAVVSPFRDPQVGCVGGKAVPLWEAALPDWYLQFDAGYLSLLDLGEETKELKWPACVWGCNMAVRKSVLFSVGGFNPDGVGNKKRIWLRGDGECGLQEKIYKNGFKTVYEPKAWLQHRIPASRLTIEYFYWRLFTQGVQESYERVRRNRGQRLLIVRLLAHSAFCFLKAAHKYQGSLRHVNSRVRLRADAWSWYGRGQHQLRTALSTSLRKHVLQESYL